MNTERKYFKCYFCHTGNSYIVPKDEKGKSCRCCLAYNYFFKKNHRKFNGKHKYYKNKKKYYNNNNNNNQNNNNYNNNNHINIINPYNNNSNIFISNSNLLLNNNFALNNPFISNNNNNRTVFPFIPFIPYNLTMRCNFFNNFPFNLKKEKRLDNETDIKVIKYPWLKKEKFTKSLIKEKEGCECSICLESFKLNEDINILKCGHIFHYNCIEELVDHKDNKCPNCRADLKTGEKQKEKSNKILDLFRQMNINDDNSDDFEEEDSNEDSEYDFDEYDYYDNN